MDYKICIHEIHEYLRTGLINKTISDEYKKSNNPDIFTGTLFSESNELERNISIWVPEKVYANIIRISQYLAYKIENIHTSSLTVERLFRLLMSVFEKENSDTATAAMNCVGNALFFYRDDFLQKMYENSFFSVVSNIIEGNSPIDLLVETLPVIANSLSLLKPEDEEDKNELLKLIDLEQIKDISAKCSVEVFENISTLLFRYISCQNEDQLRIEYFHIIQIGALMLKRFKNWVIKEDEEQMKIADRVLSSLVNVMSLILIHHPEMYVDIIDSDVVSEAISYLAPEHELIYASTLVFLVNVWNEVPKHIAMVIFSEVDVITIVLSFKVIDQFRSLTLSVLTAYILLFPLESNEPELLGIIKDVINLAAYGEARSRKAAFEFLSSVFYVTNDKNRTFLLSEGFLDIIEDCLEFDSPTNIKLVENILLFAERYDIKLSSDLIECMHENIEELTYSDKKFIANQASVVLTLFPDEK